MKEGAIIWFEKNQRDNQIMEDQVIIDMYFARDEQAISCTADKYGRLLRSIAYGILRSQEDSEECENDTYMKT